VPVGESGDTASALLQNRYLVVDVTSVSRARRLPVDEYAKTYGSSRCRRSHDEMDVSGVEAVRDPPVAWFSTMAVFSTFQSPARAH
jgi:hypothetical protein